MKKGTLRIIIALSFVLSALSLVFSQTSAQGNPGAIWTTRNTCGSPDKDVNIYQTGETVYVNGNNFDPGSYPWSIVGQPGGASGDPGQTVAGGTVTLGEDGAFCFAAYTIPADDWGTYNVTVGNKGDNYRVNQQPTATFTPTATNTPTNTPPATNTPTNIPTNTATNTPTNTPTEALPPTSTPTQEFTPMATNTPPLEPSPTNTPTTEPTELPTSTPTTAPEESPTPTLETSSTPDPEEPAGTPTPTPAPSRSPQTGGGFSPALLQTAAAVFGLISIGSYAALKKLDE